jgi:hypothetical protein
MEERRMGYVILKLTQELKRDKEGQRNLMVQLAKYTRPQRVEHLAKSQNGLRKLQADQIIHLTGTQIADNSKSSYRN